MKDEFDRKARDYVGELEWVKEVRRLTTLSQRAFCSSHSHRNTNRSPLLPASKLSA